MKKDFSTTNEVIVDGEPRSYSPEEILLMYQEDPELSAINTTWVKPYAEDFRLAALIGKAIEKLGYESVVVNEELGLQYGAEYLGGYVEKEPVGLEQEDLEWDIILRSIPSFSDVARAVENPDDRKFVLSHMDNAEDMIRDGVMMHLSAYPTI